jgi:oxygen-independent coproporphyrinogen-3 oxidase
MDGPLAGADLGFEFMLNALRLLDGFPEGLIEERIGGESPGLRERIERARLDGLLEVSDARVIRPTADGFRFLNDLQVRFLA